MAVVKSFCTQPDVRASVTSIQQMRGQFGPYFAVSFKDDTDKDRWARSLCTERDADLKKTVGDLTARPYASVITGGSKGISEVKIQFEGENITFEVKEVGADRSFRPLKQSSGLLVVIRNLPCDISDESLLEVLKGFGKVENIVRGKYEEFPEIETGVRYVFFSEVQAQIPSVLQVAGCRAGCYYNGMPRDEPACFNCKGKGHMARECPNDCGFCHKPGHISRDCDSRKIRPPQHMMPPPPPPNIDNFPLLRTNAAKVKTTSMPGAIAKGLAGYAEQIRSSRSMSRGSEAKKRKTTNSGSRGHSESDSEYTTPAVPESLPSVSTSNSFATLESISDGDPTASLI